jgi:hypothetical protein
MATRNADWQAQLFRLALMILGAGLALVGWARFTSL